MNEKDDPEYGRRYARWYDPNLLIREAGSTPVIYECWAEKDHPEQAKGKLK